MIKLSESPKCEFFCANFSKFRKTKFQIEERIEKFTRKKPKMGSSSKKRRTSPIREKSDLLRIHKKFPNWNQVVEQQKLIEDLLKNQKHEPKNGSETQVDQSFLLMGLLKKKIQFI